MTRTSTALESPARRRIVVVGGVAGGMSFAARSRRLDENAEILVLERGPHVSFASCGLPYFVGGEILEESQLLRQTPSSLAASLDLDVRTGHEVIGLDAERRCVTVRHAGGTEEIGYDELVLAPGARAVRPPVPGLDSPRVHVLRSVQDALAMRELVTGGARRAVVLGAGFIGVETAESLAARGLEVALVEAAPHVLPHLEREMAQLVTIELRELGIDVRAGLAASELRHEADHDLVVLADGSQLEADLVVLSVGVRPETAVFEAAGVACEDGAILVDEHGRTNLPGVRAVGDATLSVDAVTGLRRPVALAGPANRAGRLVADHLARPESARPIPKPLGTAVVRVGSLTAASTGANRAALERAGIPFRTLHLHPLQHAGYVPGASPVHLLVHLAQDGALLGAQAVGREGADKRIDVLATALRAGLRVDELIDLDLAYAPFHGQAKDPVNLVGMVGQNVLEGTLSLWYASELESVRSAALVLDVRSPEEYRRVHLPGSLNIPHTELRRRIDEVLEAAAGRPVRVLCASGVRSAIAHRVLVQHGLDSASLSGGMQTLSAWLGDEPGSVLEKEQS